MTSFDHAFWTYFFTRKKKPYVKWFVIGSIAPDIIYFFAFAYLGIREALLSPLLIVELIKLVISGYSPDVVSELSFNRINVLFGQVFADPLVASLRMMTHSLFLWLIPYIVLIWITGRRRGRANAFLWGWCGHVIVDVITHATDAIPFLYPISNLTIRSPISYWNPGFYGREFYQINFTLIAFAILFLLYEGGTGKWRKKLWGILIIPKWSYRIQAFKKRGRQGVK